MTINDLANLAEKVDPDVRIEEVLARKRASKQPSQLAPTDFTYATILQSQLMQQSGRYSSLSASATGFPSNYWSI
jgi:hypothetical protein